MREIFVIGQRTFHMLGIKKVVYIFNSRSSCSVKQQKEYVEAFQYLERAYKKFGVRLSGKACNKRARSNGLESDKSRFRLDTRGVVKHQNRVIQGEGGGPIPGDIQGQS